MHYETVLHLAISRLAPVPLECRQSALVRNYSTELSAERLFNWHAALVWTSGLHPACISSTGTSKPAAISLILLLTREEYMDCLQRAYHYASPAYMWPDRPWSVVAMTPMRNLTVILKSGAAIKNRRTRLKSRTFNGAHPQKGPEPLGVLH